MFLSEKSNAALITHVSKSFPSDNISLDAEADKAITELWANASYITSGVNYAIPSDLIYSGTIPLLDCIIHFDERSVKNNANAVADYRVVIFKDYCKSANNAPDDTPVCVGAVSLYLPGQSKSSEIISPIYAIKGESSLSFSTDRGYRHLSADDREEFTESFMKLLNSSVCSMLGTWYGIQIALLHPLVKNIFSKPGVRQYRTPGSLENSKKRNKVKYIKTHVITASAVESVLYGDEADRSEKPLNRRKLLWYVIGHWRRYANGHCVFVRPYWKGALREVKSTGDDRERVIALE